MSNVAQSESKTFDDLGALVRPRLSFHEVM